MIQEQGAYLSPKMLERIEHYNRLVAEGYSHIRIYPKEVLAFDDVYVMPALGKSPETATVRNTDASDLSDMILDLIRIIRKINSKLDHLRNASNPSEDLFSDRINYDRLICWISTLETLRTEMTSSGSSFLSYFDTNETDIASETDTYNSALDKIASLSVPDHPITAIARHSTLAEQVRELAFHLILHGSLSEEMRTSLRTCVQYAETIDAIYHIICCLSFLPDIDLAAIDVPFRNLLNQLTADVSSLFQYIHFESIPHNPEDKRIHTILPQKHKLLRWQSIDIDSETIYGILRELIDPLNEVEAEGSHRLVLWGNINKMLSSDGTLKPITEILQDCLRRHSLCGAGTLTEEAFDAYLKNGECLILIQAEETAQHIQESLQAAITAHFPGNTLVWLDPPQSPPSSTSDLKTIRVFLSPSVLLTWSPRYPMPFSYTQLPESPLIPTAENTKKFSYMSDIRRSSLKVQIQALCEELLSKEEQQRLQEVADLFADDDIIYIVGGAGYGKSLFLRRICTTPQMLKGFEEEPRLILRGDIKQLVRDDGSRRTMMDFLQDCFREQSLRADGDFSQGFLTDCLKEGRCLVLLDALDEVGNEHREELHSLIISFFTTTYPGNKVCITSRDRGFIPRKNITCFYIQPVGKDDIISYADRFISLNLFSEEFKDDFVAEASKLVEKQFVKGFLTLSLLLTIYREEGKLPDDKLQLYQKCFEYMANLREKEKDFIRNTKTGKIYDWDILDRFLSDESFMLLADRAVPNNRDISDRVIKKVLTDRYGSHFPSPLACKNAVDEFLQFCGDRTEVFVPSINSNTHYRFFHRSFFEYFYAQYICTSAADVQQICTMLESFDVDSEIYELLVMSYWANDCDDTVETLTEHLFHQAALCGSDPDSNDQAKAFEMLVMLLQVLDEPECHARFAELLYSTARELDGQILRTPFRMTCNTADSDHLHDLIRGSLDSLRDKMMQSLLQRYLQNRSVYDQYLLSLKEHTGQAVSLEDLEMQKQFFFPMLLLTRSDHCEQYDRMFQRAASRSYLLGPMGLKRKDADYVQRFLKDVSELPPQDRTSICYKLMLENLA